MLRTEILRKLTTGEISPKDVYKYFLTEPVQTESIQDSYTVLDALNHTSIDNSVKLELARGLYKCTIIDTSSMFDNKFYVPLVIACEPKSLKLISKGQFDDQNTAQEAYKDLTIEFRHNGGQIQIYYDASPSSLRSGHTRLLIETYDDIQSCQISRDKIKWYQHNWTNNKSQGAVVRINGQLYIVSRNKYSESGENPNAPCMKQYHILDQPWIAWPSLDGKTFLGLENTNAEVHLTYDRYLQDVIKRKFVAKEFTNQLDFEYPSTVLFPVAI